MNCNFPFPIINYLIDEPPQKIGHMLQNSFFCGGAHRYSDYIFMKG